MSVHIASPLIDRLSQLEPLLNAAAQKELAAVRKMMDALPGESLKEKADAAARMTGIAALFPGQTAAEIENSVLALLRESRMSVPALARRARAFCDRSSGENLDELSRDLKSLKTTDLKTLGKALDLPLAGLKADIMADLRRWLDSGGRVRPVSPKEQARQAARAYSDRTRGLMDSLTSENADRVLAVADDAYKDKALGREGFAAFAKGLGITVSGSKPTMRKQLRDFVNRLAVTHVQTQF